MTGTHALAAPHAEPNVTPMIDVLLVLLVIFMLIVPQVPRSLDVALARPSDDGDERAARTVVVEAAVGGRFAVEDDGAPDDASLTATALRGRLDALHHATPNAVLLVRGAPDASYQDVIGALDVARGVGITHVGLAPRAPSRHTRHDAVGPRPRPPNASKRSSHE